MNIYINTTRQPASVSADSQGIQSTSALAFKRGTTVLLNVFLKGDDFDAADIATMRFGVKLKDVYDDFLTVFAETTEAPEETDSGWKFVLKPHFSAAAIDKALGVGAAADIAKAEFISEFEWLNAAGEISASATVPTTLHNNIVRDMADGVAPDPTGDYAALMVVKMSWADYTALTEKDPEVLYLIPDAPNELEEHNAAEDAHAELFAALKAELVEKINACATTDALAEILAGLVPKTQLATVDAAGLVKLGTANTVTPGGVVGVTANGQMVVPDATETIAGVVKLGGWGIKALPKGLSVQTPDSHSGLRFNGSRQIYVYVAAPEIHPTAGTVAPTATDTNEQLVVLNATTTLPGGVRLATGVDDTGDVAVLTAAQVKMLLVGKAAMTDVVSLSLALSQLEARIEALENG